MLDFTGVQSFQPAPGTLGSSYIDSNGYVTDVYVLFEPADIKVTLVNGAGPVRTVLETYYGLIFFDSGWL